MESLSLLLLGVAFISAAALTVFCIDTPWETNDGKAHSQATAAPYPG